MSFICIIFLALAALADLFIIGVLIKAVWKNQMDIIFGIIGVIISIINITSVYLAFVRLFNG